MEFGHFVSPGWESGPVGRASTLKERLRGLRPSPAGRAIWLPGSSVHSFGMSEEIVVVGLDRNLSVVDLRVLPPGRMVWLRGARSILELPVDRPPPSKGSHLTWQHARSADPLRDADRQPW